MSIAVVRLYRQHDMDLITLFFDENVRLCKLMKRTLVNYVNGDDVEMLSFDEPSKTEGYVPKCIRMHIRLNEANEREKAVIDFLASMKPGFRCSFIKALFRNSCAYIPMVGYTTGSEFLTRKLKSVSAEEENVNEVSKDIEDRNNEENIVNTIPVTEVLEPLNKKSILSEDNEVQEIKPHLPKRAEDVLDECSLENDSANTNNIDNASLDDMFDQFNSLG